MSSSLERNMILVIDDDPDCREMIAVMAEIWGIPVLQAPDCAKGLQILKRENHRIKIVLLDYFMPGMEPGQCADSIVVVAGPEIPVVLMTAAVDPAVRASQLKLTQYLSKPFEMSTLAALLNVA